MGVVVLVLGVWGVKSTVAWAIGVGGPNHPIDQFIGACQWVAGHWERLGL